MSIQQGYSPAQRETADMLQEGMNLIKIAALPINVIANVSTDAVSMVCQAHPTLAKGCSNLTDVSSKILANVAKLTPEPLQSLGRQVDSLEEQAEQNKERAAQHIENTYGIPSQETRQSYDNLELLALAGLGKAIHTIKTRKPAKTKFNGRIDQSRGYRESVKDFMHPPKEFNGKFSQDVLLARYHDASSKKSSHNWWMPISQGNKMHTMDEVMDRTALLSRWCDRSHVSVARIPAGAPIRFLHGKAQMKIDTATGETRPGGGVQYRFEDFDPNWVVETRPLPASRYNQDRIVADFKRHGDEMIEFLKPRIEAHRQIAALESESKLESSQKGIEAIHEKISQLDQYDVACAAMSNGFQAAGNIAKLLGNAKAGEKIIRYGEGAVQFMNHVQTLATVKTAVTTALSGGASFGMLASAAIPVLGLASAALTIGSLFKHKDSKQGGGQGNDGMVVIMAAIQQMHKALSEQISQLHYDVMMRFDRVECKVDRSYLHMMQAFLAANRQINDVKTTVLYSLGHIESDLQRQHIIMNAKMDAMLLKDTLTTCANIENHSSRYGTLSAIPHKKFINYVEILENSLLGKACSHKNFNGGLVSDFSSRRLNEMLEGIKAESLYGYLAAYMIHEMEIRELNSINPDQLPNIGLWIGVVDHYLNLRSMKHDPNYDRNGIQIDKIIESGECIVNFIEKIPLSVFTKLLKTHEANHKKVYGMVQQVLTKKGDALSEDVLKSFQEMNSKSLQTCPKVQSQLGYTVSEAANCNLQTIYNLSFQSFQEKLSQFRKKIETEHHHKWDLSSESPSNSYLTAFLIPAKNEKWNFPPLSASKAHFHFAEIPKALLDAQRLQLGTIEFIYEVEGMNDLELRAFPQSLDLVVTIQFKKKDSSSFPIFIERYTCKSSIPNSKAFYFPQFSEMTIDIHNRYPLFTQDHTRKQVQRQHTAKDRSAIVLWESFNEASHFTKISSVADAELEGNCKRITEMNNEKLNSLHKEAVLPLLDRGTAVGIEFDQALEDLNASYLLLKTLTAIVGYNEEMQRSLESSCMNKQKIIALIKEEVQKPLSYRLDESFLQIERQMTENFSSRLSPTIEAIRRQLVQLAHLHLSRQEGEEKENTESMKTKKKTESKAVVRLTKEVADLKDQQARMMALMTKMYEQMQQK